MDVVLDVTYAVKPAKRHLLMIRAGGTIVLAGSKGGKAIPNFMSDQVLMKENSQRARLGVTRGGYTSAIRTIESLAGFNCKDARIISSWKSRTLQSEPWQREGPGGIDSFLSHPEF